MMLKAIRWALGMGRGGRDRIVLFRIQLLNKLRKERRSKDFQDVKEKRFYLQQPIVWSIFSLLAKTVHAFNTAVAKLRELRKEPQKFSFLLCFGKQEWSKHPWKSRILVYSASQLFPFITEGFILPLRSTSAPPSGALPLRCWGNDAGALAQGLAGGWGGWARGWVRRGQAGNSATRLNPKPAGEAWRPQFWPRCLFASSRSP